MLGNTVVLPHADGNITCIKINQDSYASQYLYKGALSETSVRIRHTKTKATADKPVYERHNVEAITTIYATADAAEYQRKDYYVMERKLGDTDVKQTDALFDLGIASANAFLVSLVNWES